MIWTIIAVLVVLWILGTIAEIGGALINLLLIIAAIALVWNLVTGRHSRV